MKTPERVDIAIEASADALLAVCALQTGTDPMMAVARALQAIATVADRAERENTK